MTQTSSQVHIPICEYQKMSDSGACASGHVMRVIVCLYFHNQKVLDTWVSFRHLLGNAIPEQPPPPFYSTNFFQEPPDKNFKRYQSKMNDEVTWPKVLKSPLPTLPGNSLKETLLGRWPDQHQTGSRGGLWLRNSGRSNNIMFLVSICSEDTTVKRCSGYFGQIVCLAVPAWWCRMCRAKIAQIWRVTVNTIGFHSLHYTLITAGVLERMMKTPSRLITW